MIFTNAWLNFFPAFIQGGGGAVSVTAACGTSSSATTAEMTALVAQAAAALSVIVSNTNNRLSVVATYGPGSSFITTEHALWVNSVGYSSAFARWLAPPLTKGVDQYFNADYAVDYEEVA